VTPGDDRERVGQTRPGLLSAAWFRVALVVIILGAIATLVTPTVLDWMTPPPPPAPVAVAPPAGTPVPAPATAPAPAATPAPAAPAPPPAATAPTPPPPPAPMPAAPRAEPAATAVAKAPAPARTAPAPALRGGAGEWYVQVGAFTDPAAARRLASRLREIKYEVVETTRPAAPRAAGPTGGATPGAAPPSDGAAADRYEVFVSGQAAADVTARVTGRGLTAEASGNGAVLRPSLPLRDAIAVSRELAADGLPVQVRRAGGAPAAPAPAPSGGAGTIHRVRVGGFADRPTAVAALRELEGKGYTPFVARGRE
jgi:hypothetical protein